MKYWVYILTLLPCLAFGQTMTERQIEEYVKTIDSLQAENRLVKVSYPNMSPCGGAVEGYYLNKELVFIEATFSFELSGFFSQTFYIRDSRYLKLIYRKVKAEEDKYLSKYPVEDDEFEFDLTKMTYTDTVYSIVLTNPPVLQKGEPFQKRPIRRTVSTPTDISLMDRLLDCGEMMKLELQTVIQQIDSLKFVADMPYISESGLCGDRLYWEAVRLGENAIELLIDKLDDTTETEAFVRYFGGNYTIADIAYTALKEIIHGIPTFELLGVKFDEEGCGYCSYWQYVNEDFRNRQNFKYAVWEWYHKNKDNLVWEESNEFTSCDCKGKHPNGGHYRLKEE